MSVINQNLLLAGDDAYNLTKSLRFRSSATANLQRTPASTSNQNTWTWSGWVKRGKLGSVQYIFGTYPSSSQSNSNWLEFGFDSSDILIVGGWTVRYLGTTQVFRDPSAWYHIVLAIDSTQATSSNRVKFYVNGVQITAFATNNAPSLNQTMGGVNSTVVHCIANSYPLAGTNPFDGYIAENHFIDGQQLTPSSFGSTNAQTGVWQPAKYTGTYGTNGFYLPFTDNSALTSGSNAGLGKDFSGNGNYWNTNNISITSGSTYDSMTDVPTLTSATIANYATLNPLSGRNPNISNGNLTLTASGSLDRNGVSTIAVNSGKWYAEFTCVTNWSGYNQSGIVLATSSSPWSVSVNQAFVYIATGQKSDGSSISSYGASYTTGDVIGVALDCDNGTLTFYKNGVSQGVAYSSNISGYTWVFNTYVYNNTDQQAANFGQRPFAYTPPTGFVALNTYNLPTPTIGATASTLANKYMDATLYTGNGTSQSIVNAGSFKPDFVWLKARSNAYTHVLVDSIRGTDKVLSSPSTSAENSTNAGEDFTAFNSNGFSVGTPVSFNSTNANGATIVGWQWKANGSAVSNTAGSITSQVSANTSAGFSVVTYTGTGSNATVGHGLGVAPSMVIAKSRTNGSAQWLVYHGSLSNTQALYLNATSSAASSGLFWNSTSPTSSVFSIGTSSDINVNTQNYVAYCFSAVAGYSAFGSYTGNGSTDGTFVYTGFIPKFVLMKATTGSNNWIIYDTARNTYNLTNLSLVPDSSAAENGVSGTTENTLDILSNGFKLRTSNALTNGSSVPYIYACFAENPFKYSLAR